MADTCPFCRTSSPDSGAAALALIQKRVDAKDPVATQRLACAYYNRDYGLQQDVPRAVELWTEAARLGDLDAHGMLGCIYWRKGVQQDVARGIRHWERATIQGHPESRDMFMKGLVTKAQYAEALRGYQNALEETRSHQLGRITAIMSQEDANNGSSDVQPPLAPPPGVPAADQLQKPVTEEELMSSGLELHESFTCPLQRGMWETCPFCRTSFPDSDAAALALVQKRVDAKDPKATTEHLAWAYYNGGYGLQKDIPRAIELWTEAARLGDLDAHCILGIMYCNGEGVRQDVARCIRHWQQAAIQGHPESRLMLGAHEYDIRNYGLAVRHWMIAAKLGCENSLNSIKDMFMEGHATKAQYAEALRGYQNALEETRSHLREEAKTILLNKSD
ncbi:hypothetical protein THAOC_06945 [Thalassiosira oceanica]|uniref:Uncharacterized protein n=1 Tax=Thalassiosira oceanica TaxID=159749 RepID=K0T378_THAOC|nr:hypothetical protein THAOC_06945 [Thalassiosira oceanica]|eukprot:EJK71594.1 hypothetical protein THAOC_06945 [Thalassiosira oceanica]